MDRLCFLLLYSPQSCLPTSQSLHKEGATGRQNCIYGERPSSPHLKSLCSQSILVFLAFRLTSTSSALVSNPYHGPGQTCNSVAAPAAHNFLERSNAGLRNIYIRRWLPLQLFSLRCPGDSIDPPPFPIVSQNIIQRDGVIFLRPGRNVRISL
ncbi:hypothetical protein BJX70DRAFT_70469 [Aspergillus crustosus]